MPASPQPSQGRTHRIVVNHGSVVYVNETEYRQADFAFHTVSLIAIVSIGLLGVIVTYWNPTPTTR